jgi:hypothetical protein
MQMQNLVTLTVAARLLAEAGDPVEHSALSRYVWKYADRLRPVKDANKVMVDFQLLTAHRAENIRLDPERRIAPPPSRKQSTTPRRAGAKDSPKPRGSDAPTQAAGRADEAAQNIRAQRLLREVELAKEAKSLTPTREVKEAALAAVSAMKNALALAINDTAEQIANVTGTEARLIRPHLRSFERRAADAFIRSLSDYGFVPDGGK